MYEGLATDLSAGPSGKAPISDERQKTPAPCAGDRSKQTEAPAGRDRGVREVLAVCAGALRGIRRERP